MRWEAKIHAQALVELVAMVMGGGVGILLDGRAYTEVSVESGLKRMGVSI